MVYVDIWHGKAIYGQLPSFSRVTGKVELIGLSMGLALENTSVSTESGQIRGCSAIRK
jgi:hypothetical protein